MGNHDAGRAMVLAATMAAKRTSVLDRAAALAILDEACEPYRGADAEFGDDCTPDTEFGKLLTIAFAPEGADESCYRDYPDRWDEEVYDAFSKRYGLC